ncbi:MAG: hypothetical protein SFV15_17150 [Polyangiaceae bacterium]|nr:hypothetical protein [Polyangiaceae bacterium]
MISSNYVKFAACAVLGSLVALGCTITTGDGDFDGFGGADSAGGSNSGGGKATGGTGGKASGGASSGGTSSGGAATGGSNTSGGAASGGSTTGGNGSGGAADEVMCNDAGTLMPTTVLVTCAADDPNNPCQTCIASKCCAEFETCRGGSPRTACGYGGLTGAGEAKEVQACIKKAELTDPMTIMDCEMENKTPNCAGVDPNTHTLIQCLKAKCDLECLQPD